MNYLEIENLLINTFFTFVLYCVVPLILKYFFNRVYSEKEAKKVAIINAILVFLGISAYYIGITDQAKLANPGPAFLWGFVAFVILKSDKPSVSENNIQEDINTTSKKKNIISSWKISTIILSIVIIVISAFSIYKVKDLNDKIDDLNIDISSENKLINKYKNIIKSNADQISFMDEHVAICPWDGKKLYHKYGCKNLDLSIQGMIYNVEEAISKGYSACPYCAEFNNTYSSWQMFKDEKDLENN